MYFDHVSLPPSPSQIPTYPTSCLFSLFHTHIHETKTKKEQKQTKLRNENRNSQKTNKTKIVQSKNKQKKSTKKISLSSLFCGSNYSWAWGLPWSTVSIPVTTPPKKTDFPSPSSNPVPIRLEEVKPQKACYHGKELSPWDPPAGKNLQVAEESWE